MSPITGNTVAYDTPADQSPHDLALQSIEDRIVRSFCALTAGEARRRAEEDQADPNGADERAKRYEEQDLKLMGTLRDRHLGQFEELKKRRGEAQAIADITSGAIGLPSDPEARQAVIEQRERDMNAAHRMQMGQGEQYAILDGTQPNPNGLARIDQAMPDPLHPWLQSDMRGRGENITRQVADVQAGMVDQRTGERFDKPQPHLVARAQAGAPIPPPPPGNGPTPEQQAMAADISSGKHSPMDNVKGFTSGPAVADRNDSKMRDLLRRARQLREEPRG